MGLDKDAEVIYRDKDFLVCRETEKVCMRKLTFYEFRINQSKTTYCIGNGELKSVALGSAETLNCFSDCLPEISQRDIYNACKIIYNECENL